MQDKFLNACKSGNVKVVTQMLSLKDFQPDFNFNQPVKTACEFGQFKIVKLLVKDPRVDVEDDENEAFIFAAGFGSVEIINYLVQRDFNEDYFFRCYTSEKALVEACKSGKIDVVDYLIEYTCPILNYEDNLPVRTACEYGWLNIVKRLIKEDVDVSDYGNGSIREATYKNCKVFVAKSKGNSR